MDTKKKELLGQYKNGGREWQPKGEPQEVNVYDFIGPASKAIPYGVYDVAADAGCVSVGRDHDTAAFAVASLHRWWQAMGRPLIPTAERLLVCADGAGSNDYRNRLWKVELAALAADTGPTVTVCHLPPVTSKSNKDRPPPVLPHLHELARPALTSHPVVVTLIAATTNRNGLYVNTELDEGHYPKGVKISDQQMRALPLTVTTPRRRSAHHSNHIADLNQVLVPGAVVHGDAR